MSEDEGKASRKRKREEKPVKEKKKKEKEEKTGPKRAKTAYLYFCEKHRPIVVKDMPDLAVPEIMKELAQRWKDASAEERAEFEALAAEDKKRVRFYLLALITCRCGARLSRYCAFYFYFF